MIPESVRVMREAKSNGEMGQQEIESMNEEPQEEQPFWLRNFGSVEWRSMFTSYLPPTNNSFYLIFIYYFNFLFFYFYFYFYYYYYFYHYYYLLFIIYDISFIIYHLLYIVYYTTPFFYVYYKLLFYYYFFLYFYLFF